jgi:hypothetical protein
VNRLERQKAEGGPTGREAYVGDLLQHGQSLRRFLPREA